MSVDITIQETVNEVDITVNQNVITVNVTRTTGSGGVESINGETGVVVLTTDNVNEGLINLYFTAARVRATVLTGISFVSGIAITATDTILSAFGKLQKQISSLGAVAFSNDYNDLENKPTIPTPQNLAQVLAIDNKTNDIPIVSNNGNGYAYVNDEQTVIGNDFGGTKKITMNEDSFAIETNVRATIDGKGLDFGTTTDGLGLPRLTTTQMNAIAFPTDGMLVKNTTENSIYQYDLVATTWITISGGSVTPSTLISTDADNALTVGTDSKLFVPESTGTGTVTSVTGVDGETTVATGTTTPVIGISSTYTSARDAYADAKVADTINNGTTTIAPSQNAVFDALDFTRRLITKGTGSVTGTVSETILTTLTIPANTLDSSCFIWTTMDFFKTSSGTVTIRLYINNANTLTGATLLGYSTAGSNRNVSFNRKFLVTGTSLDLLTANTAAAQVTNEFIENLYGASTVLTINPSAGIFLIYTTQNDATGTVATNKMATVQKMKL